MFREVLVSLVLALGALVALPGAPALPAACEALATAEESFQDDAGSGADAPDSAAAPLRIGSDGYYWGYLSSLGHANADREDWYVYAVPDEIDRMKVNVTEAIPLVPYSYAVEPPAYLQMFTLTVYPPAGAPVSVTSYDGTLTIADPAPGDYLVRVTTAPIAGETTCAASPPQTLAVGGTPFARNHGLYLGCDPLCAEGGPMDPFALGIELGL